MMAQTEYGTTRTVCGVGVRPAAKLWLFAPGEATSDGAITIPLPEYH
jgi:hypothetical protein